MSDLAFLDRYREAKTRLWGAAIAKNPPAKVYVKRVPKYIARDWLFVSSQIAMEPANRITPVSKAVSITKEVCEKHGVADFELLGKRKQPHLEAARKELYARMASETNWSFPRIGEFLGRDHSAIVKSLRRNNPHLMRGAV